MRNRHSARRQWALRRLAAGLPLVLPLLTGCAQWGYDQVTLGMPARAASRAFPADSLLRTENTLSYRTSAQPGDGETVLILADRGGLVCGKFLARVARSVSLAGERVTYTLRGEVDPRRAGLSEVGPLDALRALAGDLARLESDSTVPGAHARIAAGLVRALERWPHAAPQPGEFPELNAALDEVPTGGDVTLRLTPEGVYEIHYVASGAAAAD